MPGSGSQPNGRGTRGRPDAVGARLPGQNWACGRGNSPEAKNNPADDGSTLGLGSCTSQQGTSGCLTVEGGEEAGKEDA